MGIERQEARAFQVTPSCSAGLSLRCRRVSVRGTADPLIRENFVTREVAPRLLVGEITPMTPPPDEITLTRSRASSDLAARDGGSPDPVPGIVYYLPYREAKNLIMGPFEQKYVRLLRAAHGANLSAASRASGLSRRHLRALYRKHGFR